jgi:hypothetical protein
LVQAAEGSGVSPFVLDSSEEKKKMRLRRLPTMAL